MFRSTRASLVSLSLCFAIPFLLGGCSTLSKEECEAVDWNNLGYQAALDGKPVRGSVPDNIARCEENHGVKPNVPAITQGYANGLQLFCTKTTGMTFGRRGGEYAGTCSQKTEPDFLSGYQIGRLEYVGKRVDALENEVSRLRSELRDRDSRISDLESELSRARSGMP